MDKVSLGLTAVFVLCAASGWLIGTYQILRWWPHRKYTDLDHYGSSGKVALILWSAVALGLTVWIGSQLLGIMIEGG